MIRLSTYTAFMAAILAVTLVVISAAADARNAQASVEVLAQAYDNGVVYSVSMLRAQPSIDISVQEAGDGTDIPLHSDGARLDDVFVLQGSGEGDATETLTMTLGSLRLANGSGKVISATLQPAVIPLETNLTAEVHVQGTVPEVGEYRGTLTLRYRNQLKRYTLVVRRDTSQQQVALIAVSPQVRERIIPGMPVAVDIPVIASEKAGTIATIYLPTLQKIIQSNGGSDGSGAEYRSLWQNGQHVPITTDTITIEPSQSKQLYLVLADFRSLGQYQGTILSMTTAGAESTATFNIAVKDGFLVPALIITLGVFGSYVIRRWLQVDRPESIKEGGIARMRAAIENRIVDPDDCVRNKLVERLRDLVSQLQLEPDTNIDSALKEVETQLNNYLPVMAVLAQGEDGSLSKSGVRDADLGQIKTRITSLKQRVCGGSLDLLTTDVKGQNDLITEANDIRNLVVKSTARSVHDAISQLREDLETQKTAIALSAVDDALKLNLTQQLEDLLAVSDLALKETGEGTVLNMQDLSRIGGAYSEWKAERDRIIEDFNTVRSVPATGDEFGTTGIDHGVGEEVVLRPSDLRTLTLGTFAELQDKVHIPTTTELLKRIRTGDTISTIVLGLLTVLLGLQTLWVGNNTFGTWGDYIGALLWGFGLSQLNMVALPAVYSRLAMPFYPSTSTPNNG